MEQRRGTQRASRARLPKPSPMAFQRNGNHCLPPCLSLRTPLQAAAGKARGDPRIHLQPPPPALKERGWRPTSGVVVTMGTRVEAARGAPRPQNWR